ncbi:MAG: ribosomal protein S18-alanine N-acetyltransferase [Acutalibacteraceae bacterium]
MTDFVIEKMGSCHVGEIARLEKECFSIPWSEDGLKNELNNAFARFFVATYTGEIAGYIGAHNVLGEVYITNVAVFEKYRRKGVAKRLIDTLLEAVKEEKGEFVTLEVRESNTSALSLYEKCGFEKVGERKNFYEKPRENAVLMTYFIK